MSTQIRVNQTILEFVEGDITHQATDAIVNAANEALLMGGGVCGAIFRAAGPVQLQAACNQIGGCLTGNAVITPGFQLKAKYVIHAVGPTYTDGDPDAPRLLASAYRRSLEVARDHGLQSIAFPSISTGIYGYPQRPAAGIALRTVRDFARESAVPGLVRFVLFGAEAFRIFEEELPILEMS